MAQNLLPRRITIIYPDYSVHEVLLAGFHLSQVRGENIFWIEYVDTTGGVKTPCWSPITIVDGVWYKDPNHLNMDCNELRDNIVGSFCLDYLGNIVPSIPVQSAAAMQQTPRNAAISAFDIKRRDNGIFKRSDLFIEIRKYIPLYTDEYLELVYPQNPPAYRGNGGLYEGLRHTMNYEHIELHPKERNSIREFLSIHTGEEIAKLPEHKFELVNGGTITKKVKVGDKIQLVTLQLHPFIRFEYIYVPCPNKEKYDDINDTYNQNCSVIATGEEAQSTYDFHHPAETLAKGFRGERRLKTDKKEYPQNNQTPKYYL